MKLFSGFLAFILFLSTYLTTIAQSMSVNAKVSFTEPSLSPDGTEIVFVSGGDIWSAPGTGGEARLLVADKGFKSRPLFSPDFKYLTFTSTQTGNGDVYKLELSSGEITRITFDDSFEEVSGWSGDSRWIYFSSNGREVSGLNDVFKVAVSGGTPILVLDEQYTSEFFATPSSDGSSILYNARGTAARQWWRNGHSHLDESEIWIKRNNEYIKVEDRGAKNLWPLWGNDNNTIYFISDRDGKENLWSKTLTGPAKKLTAFTDGRMLWPSKNTNSTKIVFERDLAIWTYDINTGKAEPINIVKRGAVSLSPSTLVKINAELTEMVLSPDGKKVAFIARGEVFATSSKDGGEATQLTNSVLPERQLSWTTDSKSLIYVSTTEDFSNVYSYNISSRAVKRLTQGNVMNDNPVVSPNGKMIAYVRNAKELRVLDMTSGSDKKIADAYINLGSINTGAITWSPDNKWIALSHAGLKGFRNISIVSANGGQLRPVSFLSNTGGGRVVWSNDGKYLLSVTNQRTEMSQVVRIDLVPRTPVFSEDRFSSLFSEPRTETPATLESKPAAKKITMDSIAQKLKAPLSKDVKIIWEGIQQRLSVLPIGLDVFDIALSYDGKLLLLTANVAGQTNLYTYSLDELVKEQPVAKQISSTTGAKSRAVFTSDDKEIVFLEGGSIKKLTIQTRDVKPLDVSGELEVNFALQKMAVFNQAWQFQRDNFYDSAFHGRDWNGAKAKYEPFAKGSQNADELRRIINLMIGELNASHSGISAPRSTQVESSGRLGLRFDADVYERTGALKIKSIIPQSPADVTGSIKIGDFLVAVNDTLINAQVNLDRLLINKINKRVTLRVGPAATLKDSREVNLRPATMAVEKQLMYREWVKQERDYVHKISGGRLGYVHMFDMGMGSLNQLYLDLDAENHSREGVVIDVRNNNGGFVNAYALDVFTRKGYLTMTRRGQPAAPARNQLGQRALEAPTVLVTNQHSLSDAEDFTEGYKTLGLGKVVGEPTSGWIIFTSDITLFDGSGLRIPFVKITDNAGVNMELAPRQPDIFVTRPIGESKKNMDSQLDAAVQTLLKDLDTRKGKTGSN